MVKSWKEVLGSLMGWPWAHEKARPKMILELRKWGLHTGPIYLFYLISSYVIVLFIYFI